MFGTRMNEGDALFGRVLLYGQLCFILGAPTGDVPATFRSASPYSLLKILMRAVDLLS